ncbi:septum formation protein [Prevotellaceae bacterium MN60]|nr:septum formation protein [Prevotellaceae bacterium MN60]
MFNGQWSMMKYKIILASNSPRRKELLAGLDVQFEVRIIPGIDESYPETLPTMEIAEYIAQKKAKAYRETMADDELIITADTIVVLDDKVLGKPKDAEEARCMLHALSGKTHQVVTGVVLTTKELQKHFSVVSNVTFKTLSDNEIDYYVDTYKPMDKAGAYGIQEWIGYVGVTRLEGSYFNVMGLPVQRIYEAMKEFSICDGILSK